MKKILVALMTLFPSLAFAQEVTTEVNDVNGIIQFITDLINIAVPIIIALAVLVFIWGVFKYVVSDSEEAKGKGKDLMIWGIVGLFVMVSVWGLVNILKNSFNLDTSRPDNIDELLPEDVED